MNYGEIIGNVAVAGIVSKVARDSMKKKKCKSKKVFGKSKKVKGVLDY